MKEGRAKTEGFHAKAAARRLRVAHVPLEWYGNSCWRLPSGQALAEFALQAGFLAPLLFKADMFACNNGSSLNSAQSISETRRKAEHS